MARRLENIAGDTPRILALLDDDTNDEPICGDSDFSDVDDPDLVSDISDVDDPDFVHESGSPEDDGTNGSSGDSGPPLVPVTPAHDMQAAGPSWLQSPTARRKRHGGDSGPTTAQKRGRGTQRRQRAGRQPRGGRRGARGRQRLCVPPRVTPQSSPRHDSSPDSPATPDPATDWTWSDGDNFAPETFIFDDSQSGIRDDSITDNSREMDFFLLFFTEEIVQLIVRETNRYFGFMAAGTVMLATSRLLQWTDTNMSEMYSFFALVMLMGLVKKLNYRDYWSTDPLHSTPIFSKVMSVNRFTNILRSLHIIDNMLPIPDTPDRMRKIRPVFDYLRQRYKSVFAPFRNLVIDESLVLWRGNLFFRQYIPSKRHRFGLKLFVMCDCETGYIMDMILYTSTTTDITEDRTLGVAGAVVQTFIEPYLGKGHTLYVDNWYTSPGLFKFLHDNQTGCCGTVRKNRKNMPQFPPKMEKGDIIHKQANKIMAMRWQDKRDVTLLSTIHEPVMQVSQNLDPVTRAPINKPQCVIDYTFNMRLVDKSDSMISSIECARKTMKWYKKLFFHLIDTSVLNAQILYMVKTGKRTTLGEFTTEVVRQLLEVHSAPRPAPGGHRRAGAENPLRLTARHFPGLIPSTAAKKYAQKPCHVCRTTLLRPKVRKDSRYECTQCGVALCLIPCFEQYHALLRY